MNMHKCGLMLCALLAFDASAQTGTDYPAPSLPPALRNPPPHTPASGQALRNEAMHKLKQRFEQADLDASGSLTRDEAERAGLGFVVARFEQIDSAGRGKVSFDDVKRYLQQRRK